MEAWFEGCLQQRRPTVLVVGDVMCDTYLWGKVSRISTEAPVPIFASAERRHVLGGAANVAANLRALGCEVRLLGVIGADATGQCVREQLHAQGMADTWLVQDVTRPTTEKIRLIASQQQLLRLDSESQSPLSPPLVSQALQSVAPLMRDIDGVVCSDYQKGVCTPALLEPLFAMARTAGCLIFVDPKAQDFAHYRGATVIKPNLQEVERASGILVSDEAALAAAAERLLQQSQAQALLVTRGKDGMTLFQPPQAPVHLPTRAREVFDVTGAGDTVIATFSMAVLCGLPFVDAARLANVAAGIVVGKLGTATVLPEELRAALRLGDTLGERKVLQRSELAGALQYRRQRGERIVFTNGCFDLLHVGHIQYLQQARAMGDCLVVGLNDDASVRLLKGDKRPLLPQDERARLLAALACVDYVTIFSEATPLALIEFLRPHILVKGGDYTLDTVVGRKEVEAYGGEVRLVPYIPGVSTTGIIDSVIARYGTDADRT
jgi:D-beta-D-heptose 7-phosphate kinase/D-beta-D-heptose 1-phosphate adenosyltransferase